MKQIAAVSLAAMAACVLAFAVNWPNAVHAQTAKKQTAATKKLDRKQAISFLRQGYDSLQAKKYKQAVTELTTALTSGRLRQRELAQAHYYRGIANRVAKRPADAISDLSRALLAQGALNKKERADALAQRKQAYLDAGITGNTILAPTTSVAAVPVTPSAKSASGRARSKPSTTTASKNWSTSTSTKTTSASQSTTTSASPTAGITSFFSNLFSGGTSQPAATTTTTAAPPRSTSTTASTSSWSSATRITTASVKGRQPAKQRQRTSVRTAPLPARAAPPPAVRYQLQVAPSKRRGTVTAAANQVRKKYANVLRGRQASVAEKIVPGIGKMHYVQIKPFPSQDEANQLCRKLLATGFDCLVNRSN